MTQQPVFIAGPDRSGTTLMFALLASHPNISMVRRTNMWRYFHQRYGDLSRPEQFERCLHDMVRYNRMRHLRPDAARIRQEFQQGEPTYGRLFALFHEHHAQRAGKTRWGDKSLHTEHYADRVFAEFPQAKIIHMVRDPRDRYASVRKRHGQDRPRPGAATGRWLFSMRAASRNCRRYPNNYIVVQYETLAQRPEETLRQICAFIDEPFSSAMLSLEGARTYRDVGGNSSFGQIEPGVISTRSIGRFRKVLSGPELAFIQLLSGREMETWGYPLEAVRLTPAERLSFYTWHLPIQLVRMNGWLALNAMRMKRGARIPAFRLTGAAEVPTYGGYNDMVQEVVEKQA